MKTIIDDVKTSIDTLFEIKITMGKNVYYLDDHQDFSGVTKLYQLNHEVYEVINDIFFKLFPDEIQWGCQNIMTAWQNLLNSQFRLLLKEALEKYYIVKSLNSDFEKLRSFANEATERYNQLMAA
jgi:hypothetical protein